MDLSVEHTADLNLSLSITTNCVLVLVRVQIKLMYGAGQVVVTGHKWAAMD